MRLDLHTPEQFAGAELWLKQTGSDHCATATLIHHARAAGVSILNLAHPTAEVLPEDITRRPALVIMCAVASGPADWPTFKMLADATDYALVRPLQVGLAEHYVAAVNAALEVGRVLLIETTDALSHDWARALAQRETRGASFVPDDLVTAGRVGASVH